MADNSYVQVLLSTCCTAPKLKNELGSYYR